MASPRLMWAGVIRLGLPSTTSKPTFISGIDLSALTSAQPITCVKDTLPPRARDRWLLMTIRLSQSSFTGTERTLVAVGTLSETSMFCTVRAGAPRSTGYVGWSLASAFEGASGSLGTGVVLDGSVGRASARGPAFAGPLVFAVAPEAFEPLAAGAGFAGAGEVVLAGAFAGAFTGA